ncbi:F-box only protein [Dirofilaria immitis]
MGRLITNEMDEERMRKNSYYIYREINQKEGEMHQNIRRQIILTSRLNYIYDYKLNDNNKSNEEKWRNHNELSNLYMNRINMYSQITNFFHHKRKYISDQSERSASSVNSQKVDTMEVEGKISLDTPLGFFQMLPRELLYNLFDRISVNQLMTISLTSSILNSEVRRYLLLDNASRKFLAETAVNMMESIVDLDPFYAWGMLLKASTIIMDSRSRRSFLASFYCKNENIINWPGWGRCFMAFCEKWDFHECEALMHMVLCFTELNQLLCEVLPEEVGEYPSLEMEIRVRLRGLFLSHPAKDERDYGFWVSTILRTQETTKLQGKLFMIIFGPLKFIEIGRQIIDWEVLCNGSIILEHLCAKLLGPLALGFHHLMSISSLGYYAWTNDQLFILMEEISTIPYVWTFDNFAALLALRPQIFHIALFTRLSKGRMNEAAYIFHAVKIVLHRWGIFVSAAISDVMLKIFRALPAINRRLFLSSLLKTESHQLSGLLLATPFDASSFHAELSSAHSISALMALLARNLAILMPRETCEFCRRARARHKTRKKVGAFWYNSRGLNRVDWKQKMAKFRQKSPTVLVTQNNRDGISKVGGRNRLEINPKLQDLMNLFKKENEIEEVSSPKDNASILLESVSNVEAMGSSFQSPILTHTKNHMSKETISIIDSRPVEKPSLANFKIAGIILQQCADLLQSFPINCTENSYR